MEEQHLRQSIELARQAIAQGSGGPFGAVVVQQGQVIAEAVNQVVQHNDPTAHAEVLAIRRACEKLQRFSLAGCELYCSCEPCPMCLGAVYWSRVDAVYFAAQREDAKAIGFDDQHIYEELDLKPGERAIPMRQALRTEALDMMRGWLGVSEGRHY